jgi:hypothetical protein
MPRGRATSPALWLAAAASAAAAAAALWLAAQAPERAAAQAGAAPQVERTSVRLPVASRQLGAWTPLVAQKGADVGFHRAGKRGKPLLRLRDRPGRSGFVVVSTSLPPRTAIGGTAGVNLAQQRLRVGKARALLSVGAATDSVQAGVIRSRRGGLRWAIWHRTATDKIDGLVVGRSRAKRRHWYDVQLVTRWAKPGARAFLRVDGKVVAVARPRDLSGVLANRVTVGLGRPSAPEETGTLLVRSAHVKAAAGVSGGGPGGRRPGAGAPPAQPGLGPISALPGRLLISRDYETGDLSQFDWIFRVATDRIQVVGSPVREGRYAGRFEVRPGDDPLCQQGSGCFGDRAEVTIDTNETEGQERWYSWSVLVDPSMPNTQAFQVISQWHARADGRPPVAFFAQGDQLVLWIHPHRAPGDQISFVRAWSGPLRKGQWQDIKMHIMWSGSDSVGFVELWVNDVRQTFDDGTQRRYIRTMYPGIQNYFQQGYYRDASIGGTGVVYYDAFKMNAPG